MRRVRLIAACVLVVALGAAYAATNAAALPQWGECVAVAGTGHYSDANCQVIAPRHRGNFEWRTTFAHNGFFFEGGQGVFSAEYVTCVPSEEVRAQNCRAGETTRAEVLTVECPGQHLTGEIEPTKKVRNVVAVFAGCRAVPSSTPCSNTANPEEIVSNVLKGELGYINRPLKNVGLELQPELAAAKKRLVTFQCGPLSFVVGEGSGKEGFAYPPKGGGDGIIETITPVNQMAPDLANEFTVAGFENVPSNFENKPLTVLESYAFNTSLPRLTSKWSKAGFETPALSVMVAEEGSIEIKA